MGHIDKDTAIIILYEKCYQGGGIDAIRGKSRVKDAKRLLGRAECQAEAERVRTWAD